MATWNLDASHSELEFKVRHMMISTVKGQFGTFNIDLSSESEDLASGGLTVTIDVASLNTKNEQRDEHLRSVEFFDTANYPTITFKSNHIEKNSSGDFEIKGDLTIKDVTKEVLFTAELGGSATDPWGNAKVGYTVNGKINRADFGLTWNAALETGGVMVSEEVKFAAELQFIKS